MTTLLYIFIVLPAVLMIAAVGCTWIAARGWRLRSQLRQKPSTEPVLLEAISVRPFTLISLTDAFEPETAPLWETQAPALRAIAEAGPAGIELRRLRSIYSELAARYPELFNEASFAGWLLFLEKTCLLWRDGETVYMTAAGRAFLECRLTAEVPA